MPAGVAAGLRELMRREKCTAYVVFQAAFAAVLARVCDVEDLVIGTPAANRDMPALVRSAGMYANTLAMRADLRGDPTLTELLRRTRAAFLAGLRHQGFPFDQVVELAGAPRDPARNPVFQVMLVLRPATRFEHGVPGWSVCEWQTPPPAARFDLTLQVVLGEDIELDLDYSTALFEPRSAARLRDHVLRVLATMAERPETRVWDIELARPRTPAAVPEQDGEPPRVHELIARRAAENPDAPAVFGGDGRELSYGELERRAGEIAAELVEAGVGPGEVVGVIRPPGPDAVAAILGVLKAGGAYLPLDPAHPPARLRQILRAAGACAVLADDSGAYVVDRERSAPRTTGAGLAYVIYTSGSTGRPKGVMVGHETLSRLTASFVAAHGFGPGQRVLALPPLTFDASVGDLFPVLTSGAALVFHTEPALIDGKELIRFCAARGVTAVDAAAPLWRQWVEDLAGMDGPGDPEQLAVVPSDWPVRLMMVGGERVPVAAVRAWARATGGRVRLVNHYGPTEATVCATTYETVNGAGLGDAAYLPIGRPLPHVRAYVRDRRGRLAPDGTPGELCLGGDCLALGYLGDPVLTGERFVADPFSGIPGARMYRTGDLARWRPDGNLEFLGRIDRQVKIHGHLVEPAEVEAALAALPQAGEAAVTAVPGPDGHLRLVAYVTGGDPAELRRLLRERLPGYLVPSAFVRLDRLPRTRHGKTDYAALPEAAPAGPGEAGFEPPRGPVETALARIWGDLLGVARVGRRDSFFALGGHSLRIAELSARVGAELGVRPSPRELFEAADLAELAELVEARRAGRAPEVEEPPDLLAEATLPDDVVAGPRAPARPRPWTFLLTGATGFLGAHLVAELLGRTAGNLVCLVRAGSPEHALRRVRENLAAYGLGWVAGDPRLSALPGDLAAPRLGLDAGDFAGLARRIDAICHNGGLVDFARPYALLRPANVSGTVEVLRLAALGGGVPVHLVSTLGVYLGEAFLERTVTESDPPDDPRGLAGGYNQSKWVADRLARLARARGVPVTVHRPARIGGDARTGIGAPGDYFSRLLITCAQLGMVPALAHRRTSRRSTRWRPGSPRPWRRGIRRITTCTTSTRRPSATSGSRRCSPSAAIPPRPCRGPAGGPRSWSGWPRGVRSRWSRSPPACRRRSRASPARSSTARAAPAGWPARAWPTPPTACG
ncbi:non-ribosomal peptide synthetase [Thermocatellispora tengchongensis]|uniref:non-ribosomal peptide synthetase n=1 Tax=Thermocatellispora tengchongensis TaxID=1073253 RepID=UPI003636E1F1